MREAIKSVAVVGGGPAGLMAAETLSRAGVEVHLYDSMPSVGRKFLLAGKGGLNLTHSEAFDTFVTRYGVRSSRVKPFIASFNGQHVREWAASLGIETFVGTSGRVFPQDMKAAPLLRAWLHRLRHPTVGTPVQFHMRHQWTGFDDVNASTDQVTLTFNGHQTMSFDAVILALGGASWKRLGSDGAWVNLLKMRGMDDADIAPLEPSNCGFDVGWSEHFSSRFAGQALKTVAIDFADSHGNQFQRKGEFVVTSTGVEGSLIYAASSLLRGEIKAKGHATFHLDLLPDFSFDRAFKEVQHPRGTKSLSSHLKSRLGIEGVKAALLYEILSKKQMIDANVLALAIKALPLTVNKPRPIDEAISTAGGVRFEALTDGLMIKKIPRVFCAGEMLDWEAPTGGYLLTACMASGRIAAKGVLERLNGL